MFEVSTFTIDYVKKGISIGLDKIIESTLPSIWREGAVGWQQLWNVSDKAGLYASCEGVILLLKAPKYYHSLDSACNLAVKVFNENLIDVFDDNVISSTEEQERMRIHTLNTIMKISKFIQAASKVRCYAGLSGEIEDVVGLQKERIELIGDKRKGKWPCIFSISEDLEWSLAATPESIIALYESGDGERQCVKDAIIFLVNELKISENNSSIEDVGVKSIIMWVLSEVYDLLDAESLSLVDSVIKKSIKNGRNLLYGNWTDRFMHPDTRFDDYYTYNTMILANLALLNLINKNGLSIRNVEGCFPVVCELASNIIKNKAYKNNSSGRYYFWEHCQALTLLIKFINIFEDNNLNVVYKEVFMYVNPTHFNKKTFVVNDSAAVVIMPFGPEWSEVVFDAIKKSCKSKSVDVWRSDMEYGDDHIMQSVWERINSAKFVIADCTGKNPNVFYELGIAHTIGKPVFICAQKRDDIPFDLGHIRSFVYGEMTGEAKVIFSNVDKLKLAIKNFIDSL